MMKKMIQVLIRSKKKSWILRSMKEPGEKMKRAGGTETIKAGMQRTAG